jgi:hypothetical protein
MKQIKARRKRFIASGNSVYRNHPAYKDIYAIVKYMLPHEEEIVWNWYSDMLFGITLSCEKNSALVGAAKWVSEVISDAKERLNYFLKY